MPRFLIAVIDKDMLSDFKSFDYGISKAIAMLTNWLTRKIDIAVRRKLCQIRARKPGAIGSVDDPTIIYIDMIHRPQQRGMDKKLVEMCSVKYKFNRILHESIEAQGHRVICIPTCNDAKYFDNHGNLTNVGKINFWREVDDLLERFDRDKVKLLPKLHKKYQEPQNTHKLPPKEFYTNCYNEKFKNFC